MRIDSRLLPLCLAAALLPTFVHAKVTKTITFGEFALGDIITDQIPGIVFGGYGVRLVTSPPTLANAEGPSLSAAAPSGFRFTSPITEMSVKLSFDFVTTNNAPGELIVSLVGRDEKGKEVAYGSGARLPFSLRDEADWAAASVQIKSPVPMSSVAFLIGIVSGTDWTNQNQTLYFDDLTFTVAPFRRTVDFENFTKKKSKVSLTLQCPGLSFSGVNVLSPAPILNTFGVNLSGAKSGRAAACSSGARIDFAQPILGFHTYVSPKTVQVCEQGTNEVVVTGYDCETNVVAATSVLVPLMVASEGILRNDVKPSLVSLESETPIAFVTMVATGATGTPLKFYFDDVIYVPAPKVVTFEGVLDGNYVTLSGEIAGLRFDIDPEIPTYVVNVQNAAAGPVGAATSGTDAATCAGSLIQFANPVIEASAQVSPGQLSLNGFGQSGYRTIHMVGYDAKGNEIARATAPVLVAAATAEQFTAFMPTLVGLQSCLPMSFVSLDYEPELDNNGLRFVFDDLTFVRAHKVGMLR
jgi:hypothetical protein